MNNDGKYNICIDICPCEECDCDEEDCVLVQAYQKQIPKKVYHFLEDDTFETTCCGYDVTSQDFDYCPNCGQLLGGIEEVEGEDE